MFKTNCDKIKYNKFYENLLFYDDVIALCSAIFVFILIKALVYMQQGNGKVHHLPHYQIFAGLEFYPLYICYGDSNLLPRSGNQSSGVTTKEPGPQHLHHIQSI